MLADVPEQIVEVPVGVISVGSGFTVTSTVKGEPTQVFASVVMV